MRRVVTPLIVLALVAAACSGSSETRSTTTAVTVSTPATAGATTTAPTAVSVTTTSALETDRGIATDTGPVIPLQNGIGDPYYPALGNTGYDVDHYTLEFAFDPETDVLSGIVTINATAEERLDRVNLDFIGFDIAEIIVDGSNADFARSDVELTIRPPTVLPAGEEFSIQLRYSGIPQPVTSPAAAFGVGWTTSPTGQRFVFGEPDGARTWFPANDHPLDKATFTFLLTVPEPLLAAANGILVDRSTAGGQSTWVWEMNDPMAPYLATVVIGDFAIVDDPESSDIAGIPVRNVLPPDLQASVPEEVLLQGEMIEFFAELFGPFPFETYGIAVVDGFPAALENQTLSVFGRPLLDEIVVVHELAHQWFGDHVSTAQWQDIWLNEGFASYAEWLWIEANLGTGALAVGITQERDRFVGAGFPPPGLPPSTDLFSPSVYRIGAMTLHALRLTVGDEAFFTTLRTYVGRFGGGTATTGDFIAVAEEVSGQDLDELFTDWLFGADVPEFPVE